MSGKPAAPPGLRQTMSWLHTWCGLVCGWLLCAIFLTGTLSVFREPITRWMEAGPLPQAGARALSTAEREQALRLAEQHLQQAAPAASLWRIQLPRLEHEAVQLFARMPGGTLEAFLHPQTGQALAAPPKRSTEGGRHFMSFHYSLQGGLAGFWAVGLVSMGMMVALVSGVIVHRRIFADFFTFRPGKGQRSWLDAHNASAVLTLPFLFMIVYTGLAHFYTSYMPWPLQALYGPERTAYSRYQSELNAPSAEQPGASAATGAPGAASADLAHLLQHAQSLLHEPVAGVLVQRPAQGAATVRVSEQKPDTGATRRIIHSAQSVTFDAATGEVLQAPRQDAQTRPSSEVYPVISALHLVTFGGWTVKWLYFVLALIGTAMIATGMLLFSVKRRNKSGQEWGAATARMYRGIDALNIAALAGSALASVAYLHGNRLLPPGLEARAGWEIRVFFAVWALSLLHALLRPVGSAWREQLAAVALLCLALPLLNALTTGQHLGLYLAQGDGQRAGLELTVLALGLLAAWITWRLPRAGQPAKKAPQPRGRTAATGGAA